MYMYVNKHIELAQQGMALEKIYVLLLLSFSSFSEQTGIALPEEKKMVRIRLDNKQSVKSFGKNHYSVLNHMTIIASYVFLG